MSMGPISSPYSCSEKLSLVNLAPSHPILIMLVLHHTYEILVRRRWSTSYFSHFHGYLVMGSVEVEKKDGI